jgi:D-alanyl-D-alanine carboxypeptidase
MNFLYQFNFSYSISVLLVFAFGVGMFFGAYENRIIEFLSWHSYSSDYNIFSSSDNTKIYVQNDLLMFEENKQKSEKLPEGVEMIVPGQPKLIQTRLTYISRNGKNKLLFKPTHLVTKKQNNQTTFLGEIDAETFRKNIEKEIEQVYNAILASDIEFLNKKFSDYDANLNVHKNVQDYAISIESLNFKKGKIINSSFANLKLNMGECGKLARLNILYDFKTDTYLFANYDGFIRGLCLKNTLGFVFGKSCEDCTYYPVDRYNPLPDVTWHPNDIVYVSKIPGGKSISSKIYNDLIALYEEALNAGFIMRIISGFRSYQTQSAVYENWINQEMSKGYNRKEAESIAAQYSARPGYSEHQLGTTVDLGAESCPSFSDCNNKIWAWLKDNAYRFGFILSYPPNTQHITGYVYEPWHYRWIGRELASEYVKYKDKYVLTQWLKLKNEGLL